MENFRYTFKNTLTGVVLDAVASNHNAGARALNILGEDNAMLRPYWRLVTVHDKNEMLIFEHITD